MEEPASSLEVDVLGEAIAKISCELSSGSRI